MLIHWVVEVEVLEINHYVLVAWDWYETVPMNFGSREVGCWGGDWSIIGKLISYHCKLHSVHLFLLGMNATDDRAICDLGALEYFEPVDEEQVLVPCFTLVLGKVIQYHCICPYSILVFRVPSLGSGILGTLTFWGR